MEEQKNQQPILDQLDSDMQMDESWDALLDDEESMDFLCDINDLDEALNRKYGASPDIDSAWKKFEKNHQTTEPLELEDEQETLRSKVYHLFKYAVVGVAAAAFVCIMVVWNHSQETVRKIAQTEDTIHSEESAASVMAQKESQTTGEYKTITIAAGEQKNVVLPDGTEVYLNAKSTLKYAENFGKDQRQVEFCGEGYFKVHHDASHPFIIKTNTVSTKVLGTEFNLRCYNTEDVHVTLVKGSVEVSMNHAKVRISPNQDAYLENGNVMVQNVNPKDFTSWKDGILYFDNASLRTILQQLGRVYNVNVVCRDEQLLNKHFHYMCNMRDSLEEALKLLNASSDVNVKVRDNTIVID